MASLKPRMSLILKFVLVAALLVAATSAAISFFLIEHEAEIIREGLKERGKSLARGIAYNSEYGVLIRNRDILDGILRCIIVEKDVVYALITDRNGNILAEFEGESPVSIPVEIKAKLEREALATDEVLVQFYRDL